MTTGITAASGLGPGRALDIAGIHVNPTLAQGFPRESGKSARVPERHEQLVV